MRRIILLSIMANTNLFQLGRDPGLAVFAPSDPAGVIAPVDPNVFTPSDPAAIAPSYPDVFTPIEPGVFTSIDFGGFTPGIHPGAFVPVSDVFHRAVSTLFDAGDFPLVVADNALLGITTIAVYWRVYSSSGSVFKAFCSALYSILSASLVHVLTFVIRHGNIFDSPTMSIVRSSVPSLAILVIVAAFVLFRRASAPSWISVSAVSGRFRRIRQPKPEDPVVSHIRILEASLKAAKDESCDLAAHVEACTARNDALEERLADLAAKDAAAKNKDIDLAALESTLGRQNLALEDSRRATAEKSAVISRMEGDLGTLRAAMEACRTKDGHSKVLEATVETLNAELKSTRAELESKSTRVKEFDAQLDLLLEDFLERDTIVKEKDRLVHELKASLGAAQAIIEVKTGLIVSKDALILSLKALLDAPRPSEEQDKLVEQLKAKIEALESKASDSQQEVHRLAHGRDKEMGDALRSITDLKATAKRLTSEMAQRERMIEARDDKLKRCICSKDPAESDIVHKLASANMEIGTLKPHVKHLEGELEERDARIRELEARLATASVPLTTESSAMAVTASVTVTVDEPKPEDTSLVIPTLPDGALRISLSNGTDLASIGTTTTTDEPKREENSFTIPKLSDENLLMNVQLPIDLVDDADEEADLANAQAKIMPSKASDDVAQATSLPSCLSRPSSASALVKTKSRTPRPPRPVSLPATRVSSRSRTTTAVTPKHTRNKENVSSPSSVRTTPRPRLCTAKSELPPPSKLALPSFNATATRQALRAAPCTSGTSENVAIPSRSSRAKPSVLQSKPTSISTRRLSMPAPVFR